jgi:DNA-binding transcriptional LysR family regulator
MSAGPFAGDVRFLVIASPSYVAEHGTPALPDDPHLRRSIRQRLPSGKSYRWASAREVEEIAIDVPGALTRDHSGLVVKAAAAGIGIAFVSESAARTPLDAGTFRSCSGTGHQHSRALPLLSGKPLFSPLPCGRSSR